MAVSQKEKMFFTRHLALMLKGGISLTEALDTLKDDTKSKVLKKALADILRRVSEGENLHKSLEKHDRIFNKFFRSVVRVGEESGTLEENLKYLTSSLQSEYSLQRKMITALIYPIIIVVIALIIAIVISLFILPKLLGLFLALGIKLPLATKILLGMGSFLHKYSVSIIVAIVCLFLLYIILKRIKLIRFYFHKVVLSLPFLGGINKNRNLAIFSRTFYTLLKSGLPLLDSLDICIEILPNDVYKENLILLRVGVEGGEKISQELKKFPKTFPPIFSQMILVGEKTGALEESALNLAKFYETEVNTAFKNLSIILEPVLLILVGLFVAFIALAIITPIYQFTSGLRVR